MRRNSFKWAIFFTLFFAASGLYARAQILSDVHIDRFIMVVPDIGSSVISAWGASPLRKETSLDQIQHEYENNGQIIDILKEKRLPHTMAGEIFTVMVGMMVVSYQNQRDILEEKLGRSLTDQELVKEIQHMGVFSSEDIAEVKQALDFLHVARQWLGQKNFSLLNRRIGELSSVVAEL